MDTHYEFYKEVLDGLISDGVMAADMRLLVVCGGDADKEVLDACGFQDVVISNLDERMTGTEFAPFQWSYQDAEHLDFADDSFDFCVVHSGLHHCYSPHGALVEMYRVARKGVVLFEPYDNLVSRLGMRLGFGQEYEHAAVFYNDCAYGGLKNSHIPNYVYRWTEKEIIKTINCFAPYGKHRFQFMYKLRIPYGQLKGRKNKLFFFAAVAALPALRLFAALFPKQSNNFAAVVTKPEFPDDLHPWLRRDKDGIQLNRAWLAQRYQNGT